MDPVKELEIGMARMRLRIEPSEIDRELNEHPQRYFDVAEQAARAESIVASKKDLLERTEAKLFRLVRKDCSSNPEADAQVKGHPKRTKAFEDLQAAIEHAAQWRAMREAYSSRGYMLRDLCELTLSGWLAKSSVGSHGRDAKAERNKAERLKNRDDSWKKGL